MQWLSDLIDEYKTKVGPSENRIRRIRNTFSRYSDETMAEAVKQYMLAGKSFFPRVGELLPHVQDADHKTTAIHMDWRQWAKDITPEYREQIDRKLLHWEQARGTMPNDETLAIERAAAIEEVQIRVRAGGR